MKVNFSLICYIQVIFILSLEYHSYTKEVAEIFPLKCDFSIKALNPSGLTIFKGRLLFVSDNYTDRAVYELIPAGKFYQTKIFFDLNNDDIERIIKNYKLDLEGIVEVDNYFYCIDEMNRFIYKVKLDGNFEKINHDIYKYNMDNHITFSSEANAGFEGIAFDLHRRIFFIANERDQAIIYLLKYNKRSLNAIDHISMNNLLKDSECDISDLCYKNGFLYLIQRKSRKIIKIDPYNRIVYDTFNFSSISANLYKSKKGFGFAEGLLLTRNKIYLLLDSGGRKMVNKDFGKHGAIIILNRPPGF